MKNKKYANGLEDLNMKSPRMCARVKDCSRHRCIHNSKGSCMRLFISLNKHGKCDMISYKRRKLKL